MPPKPTDLSYRAIAAYYDAEHEHLDMLRQDVGFFLRQVAQRSARILELGAGDGRAAIPMAQAGHRVVGVDYEAAMIERGAAKAGGVGVKPGSLEFVRADMLDADLGRTFDWVCLFFNTFLNFTTLEKQDRVLQTVQRHLAPHGRFWLDIFHPDPARLAGGPVKGVDPISFFVPELNRTVMKTVELRPDVARQISRVTYHYTWFDDHGRERRERTTFEMTFLFSRELRLLLERNGLRIEKLWGDYDGSDLTANSSRMIARCCRQ